MKSSREAALHIVYRVLEEGAFASLAANEVLKDSGLDARDRSLAREIAYTAIKAWNTIDWALNLYLSRKKLEELPAWIRCVLRIGASQILFLSRIPPWAAVYETVALAKRYGHRGTAGLVNAVLRRLLLQKEQLPYPDVKEDPVGYISLRYHHPSWMVAEWLSRWGLEETIALCQANNVPPPLTIRVNTLKADVSFVREVLAQEGVTTHPCRYAPEGLVVDNLEGLEDSLAFKRGLFYVQDEASMLVSHALNPYPGSTVVDAAAAPGGKTTHLAQLMKNQGQILAFDTHEKRLYLIADNCRRLGVTCVELHLEDARRLGARYPSVADYLLVDAPCSGLGVLRRRPDARWRKDYREMEELAELQLAILKGSLGVLKPGGVLLYSTCTLTWKENEGVINRFLQEIPGVTPEDLSAYLPSLPRDLREQARRGQVQFLPHKHGTDGFYIARLRKIGS
ncbi:16S rRNA (cytosine967-C5)-methyltransferase [Thermanaeromonas toyohensis ToBE]|uniref:16S rRNA (cytosine(967)-C(5))-methyltransferase n=1 Tax=Thermanaeromonas toyohensis ToBE TaxID=698762 RepID=A0A1W1VMW3_9FIRM|nr:16S rRNA (cytosine(967)-C(5))-methyltransferase RsmB [Thermanaeromonas toyohensis]SMB94623.1 16S rRNA (cytosine967-C5)-methyltransferase [Thermanaeromonas toyohensis ToBE]